MIPLLILVMAFIVAAITICLPTSRNPIEWSGPRILADELSKLGIRRDNISRDFYEECTSLAEHAATTKSTKASRQQAFIAELLRIANMLEVWQRDPRHPMFSANGQEPNIYRALFERHGL